MRISSKNPTGLLKALCVATAGIAASGGACAQSLSGLTDGISLMGLGVYAGVSGAWSMYETGTDATTGGSWVNTRDVGAVSTFTNRSLFRSRPGVTAQGGIKANINGIIARVDVDWTDVRGRNTYDSGNINSSSGSAAFYRATSSSSFRDVWTYRLGLGFENFYVSGGLAVASIDTTQTLGFTNPAATPALPGTIACAAGQTCATLSARKGGTTLGWAIGAGIEVPLPANLSARLEYVHARFPARGMTETHSFGGLTYPVTFGNETSLNMFRFGINYTFGNV